METFVVLDHTVTNSVPGFNNPDKLTNDHLILILKLFDSIFDIITGLITRKWPFSRCYRLDIRLEAEIVETTFVVSRFSDIRKETTSFLVVSKKTDQDRRSSS